MITTGKFYLALPLQAQEEPHEKEREKKIILHFEALLFDDSGMFG